MKRWFRMSLIALLGVILLGTGLYFALDTERGQLDQEVRSRAGGEFVELSRGWVHYQAGGPADGRAVVLVHGFSVPYYVWDPTFQFLVDQGYRVLRYDLYGRGISDRPEVKYDLDLFTEQLAEMLTAVGFDGGVDLVGLSFGGPVVARYAVEHPQQVRSVTLISPHATQTRAVDVFPLNVPGLGEYVMAVYLEPFMFPSIQKQDFYQPDRFPMWEERYRGQLQYQGFRRALLSTIRHLVGVDPIEIYEALGRVEKPVLLIWGEEDHTYDREAMGDVVAAVPGIRFETVPQAGHISHYERPELVNPLLVSFFERVSAGSAP